MARKLNEDVKKFGSKLKSYNMGIGLFEHIIKSPQYRAMFIARALEGELHPSLEILMFHYILGKPSETIDLNINDNRENLTELSEGQLRERVLDLHTQLKTIDVAPTNQGVN